MLVEDPTLILCAICRRMFNIEELGECCGCRERICYDCPAFACACIYEGAKSQPLRVRMRAAAIELAKLKAEQALLGSESLIQEIQALILPLEEIVSSLRDEIDAMDDESVYGAITTTTTSDTSRLLAQKLCTLLNSNQSEPVQDSRS